PDGELLGENDLFSNPELANTLEMLGIEGIEEMYQGDLARAIAASCAPDGLLGMDDLAQDQVQIRTPLKIKALDGQLLTNPPPSSGGCLMAFTLHLIGALKQQRPELAMPVLLAECLHATSTERCNGFDRQVHQADIEKAFLSPQRWQSAFQQIIQRLDKNEAFNSGTEPANRHGSTTHISVVDGQGMAVSVTTSNGEGSGIVVPGTGIHLNNMLGEEDINPLGFHKLPAGSTLSSMMAPTIFLKQGRPWLVLGSGGSNRLRGAILQVLLRHIILGQDIETAVHAPRLHNEDHVLDVEPERLSPAERQQLLDLGWAIRDWKQRSVYFGGVHAISIDDRGQMHGAGDPRRGGCVAWA
ncbi:MAG: gamma-glutamyltransferase, partial [Mariprofundaceae bacterium]